MVYKNLGFVFQPAKSTGVDNAITIALKLVAALQRGLCMATPAAFFWIGCVRS
jgi:hypothetical protein